MNPLLDYYFDYQKTAWSESFRMADRWFNATKVPQLASKVQIAHTPHDVVYEEHSLQLLRFRSNTVDLAEPILICYALVNRPYILDLQSDRSVVQQLLKRGFDVYLIDWGIPTSADRSLGLSDYVNGLLRNVVNFVCDRSSTGQINLLGYCMGGTMSTMYTSLYQEQIRNLILMAAPIDFHQDDSLLALWTREEYFDVDGLVDAFGNCPGSFLQSAFHMRNPIQNYYVKYLSFFEKLDDEDFIKNYLDMEHWANDNIPVAGETFREFVKQLYQRNELVRGEFRLDGEQLDLKNITCPLLLLTADRDDLVPATSSLALQHYVGSQDVETMSVDAGHIGLAVGRRSHRHLWPGVAMWIADRCTHAPAS